MVSKPIKSSLLLTSIKKISPNISFNKKGQHTGQNWFLVYLKIEEQFLPMTTA
jgi:predicted SprT family Zn-dependent metalloprotease